jgi:predicted porin
MKKNLFLIYFCLGNLWAQEIAPVKKYLFEASFLTYSTISKWDEEPYGFNQSDIAAPFGVLKLKLKTNRKPFNIKYNVDYAKNQAGFNTLLLKVNGEWTIKEVWRLGAGLIYISNNADADRQFENSIYENTISGFEITSHYDFRPDLEFYLNLEMTKVSETSIDKIENSETRLNHETMDSKISLGVVKSFNDFRIFAEYADYVFYEVDILSKDFAYTTENQKIQKYTVGGIYPYKKYEFGLSYSMLTSPDDEISYFYQVPRFHPDYLLAKEYVTLEFKWKI